jgi:hypothetical protein
MATLHAGAATSGLRAARDFLLNHREDYATVKPGSMGRPLPGYVVALLDPISGEPAEEGEITLDLSQRPLGLMTGYRDSAERMAAATARVITTLATSLPATTRATSPTSDAPTMSSRRRAIGSRRSSSRAC